HLPQLAPSADYPRHPFCPRSSTHRRADSRKRSRVGLPLPRRHWPAGWSQTPHTPSVEDMTTVTAQDPSYPAANDHYRPSLIRQLGMDTAYVLAGFPLSIVTFVIIITGISVSAGLLVTLLGIPLLVATLFISRGFAELERIRIASVLR